MQLLNVTPITRRASADTLTYFSAKEVVVGNVVLVPLRRKTIYGLVTSVRSVMEEKSSIRASKIEFKRILKILPDTSFSPECISAAKKIARFHATGLGSVLFAITPHTQLKKSNGTAPQSQRTGGRKLILQTDEYERCVQYRSLIRESFLKGQSVCVLLPTIQDVEKIAHNLSKGIQEFTVTLHSGLRKRILDQACDHMAKETHPLLIISTPGFLALLPKNTGTLILERENSRLYKQMARPCIDFRICAEMLAETSGYTYVVGDHLLSTEIIARYKKEEFQELNPPKWRVYTKALQTVVDMKVYKPDLRGKLTPLSRELEDLVRGIQKTSDHLFIYVARKGLAPLTLCGDCGSTLVCKNCGASEVLHKTANNVRFYLCHRCGVREDATLRCRTCNSWKLVALGAGAQSVEEALQHNFPAVKIFRLDANTAENRKEAREMVEQFYQTPGSILVGTELAIPYVTDGFGFSAVASIDALFSIPDFRVHERVLHTLLTIRALTRKHLLIQTRQTEHEVIKFASEGNLSGFYERELTIRKALKYPPYSVFIKISISGEKKKIADEMGRIKTLVEPYEFSVFPTFIKRNRGKAGLAAIVKIPTHEWPNEKLLSALYSLPLSIQIQVDPESIL